MDPLKSLILAMGCFLGELSVDLNCHTGLVGEVTGLPSHSEGAQSEVLSGPA